MTLANNGLFLREDTNWRALSKVEDRGVEADRVSDKGRWTGIHIVIVSRRLAGWRAVE